MALNHSNKRKWSCVGWTFVSWQIVCDYA